MDAVTAARSVGAHATTMSTIAESADREAVKALDDWPEQPAVDGAVTMPDEAVAGFVSTQKLQERMLVLSMAPCLFALAVPGDHDSWPVRCMFAFFFAVSLLGLALRRVVARLPDQQTAFRVCGGYAVVSANIEWCVYHSLTDAPIVFNLRPFLLLLGCAYMCFFGVNGTLVTTPAQHVVVSMMVLAHNMLAQSRVPEAHKLFSDLEALVSTILCVGGVLAYYFHETPAERARLEAEATARQAADAAAELDRQVMALEQSRREALISSKGQSSAAGGGMVRRPGGRGTSSARATREMSTPSIPEGSSHSLAALDAAGVEGARQSVL